MRVIVYRKGTNEVIRVLSLSRKLARLQYSIDDQEEIAFSNNMPVIKPDVLFPFPVVEGIPKVSNKDIKKYRVAMISSWDITCGIAEYTKELVRWIDNVEVIPVTEIANFNFSPFHLIHIQYEPGLFKHTKMVLWELIRKWKTNQKKVVLTAHYYDDWFAEVLSEYCDIIIVHDSRFSGKPNHKYLIQGCPVHAELSDIIKLRTKLELPLNAKILTGFGFIMRWKQLDYVYSHLIPYIQDNNQIYLQMLHSFHNRDPAEGKRIKKAIKELVRDYGVQKQVFISHDFLSKDEINQRIQASNLGFLWKGKVQSRGSSAVSKEYISGRCPIVSCQTSHYADLSKGIKFVSLDIDIESFCRIVIETLEDNVLLTKLKNEQRENYKALNYKKIGRWHEELYDEICDSRDNNI